MIDWEKVARACDQMGYKNLGERIRHPDKRYAQELCLMLLTQEAAKGIFMKQDGSGSLMIMKVVEFCKAEASNSEKGLSEKWEEISRRIYDNRGVGMVARQLLSHAQLGNYNKRDS